MAKRLSDVAAIVSRPIHSDGTVGDTSVSASVRRIENGYVCCESRSGPEGYSDREYYTESPPRVTTNVAGEGVVGPEGLSGARVALQRGPGRRTHRGTY